MTTAVEVSAAPKAEDVHARLKGAAERLLRSPARVGADERGVGARARTEMVNARGDFTAAKKCLDDFYLNVVRDADELAEEIGKEGQES